MKIVWHYGYAPNAYSSLILKIPEKESTMILLANSDGQAGVSTLETGMCLILLLLHFSSNC
jgi:hypothetical protein